MSARLRLGSRRDFMRWTAVAAGAIATARYGVAAASPSAGSWLIARYAPAMSTRTSRSTCRCCRFRKPSPSIRIAPSTGAPSGRCSRMSGAVWSGTIKTARSCSISRRASPPAPMARPTPLKFARTRNTPAAPKSSRPILSRRGSAHCRRRVFRRWRPSCRA